MDGAWVQETFIQLGEATTDKYMMDMSTEGTNVLAYQYPASPTVLSDSVMMSGHFKIGTTDVPVDGRGSPFSNPPAGVFVYSALAAAAVDPT